MSPRTEALTAFGKAVAQLPFNAPAIREALVEVEKCGGQELAVEAMGTMMAFEAVTRIVDATIRVNPPAPAAATILADVNVWLSKTKRAIKSRVTQITLASGVLFAAVAIGLYSRFTM